MDLLLGIPSPGGFKILALDIIPLIDFFEFDLLTYLSLEKVTKYKRKMNIEAVC